MARPLRIQYPGAFYHVTCRGNKRQKIFLDDYDRHRFLRILRESLEIYSVVLYFYVLMDNHFHLGIQTIKANLSEFMRRFNISYTGWFNFQHATYGHLYQGRFKAILVDADNYLLELSRYIHLNPVRAGKCVSTNYKSTFEHIKRLQWSSLPGYLMKNHKINFINYDMVLGMVGGRRRYNDFLLEGLKNGVANPFKGVQHQIILGDNLFLTRVKNQYLKKGSLTEQPSYRNIIADKVDLITIIECVKKIMEISVEDILKCNGNAILRGIVSELLYRYSNMTQKEIGLYLGIDHSAVSRLRSHLKQRLIKDVNLVELYEKIVNTIKKQMSNVKI